MALWKGIFHYALHIVAQTHVGDGAESAVTTNVQLAECSVGGGGASFEYLIKLLDDSIDYRDAQRKSEERV